jgi:hypothetical protein
LVVFARILPYFDSENAKYTGYAAESAATHQNQESIFHWRFSIFINLKADLTCSDIGIQKVIERIPATACKYTKF